MSWKALAWASEQQCRTSAEKFVLIMLANHADEQYTCFPSVEKLADETQLGESTVRRCVKNLVEDKRLRVLQRWGRRGSRRSNRYQVLIDGPEMSLPEHGDWKYEYEYVPQPKGSRDGPGAGEQDSDSAIPLGASGIADQGIQTSQSERFAQSERFEPPGARGPNLPEREVSNQEESPWGDPHGESPPTPAASAAPVEPEAPAGGDAPQKPETTLADISAWFVSQRPTWRRRDVEEALTAAAAGRSRPVAEVALVLQALALPVEQNRYGKTDWPRRLLIDGPWWNDVLPAPPTPAVARQRVSGPRCPKSGHGGHLEVGCRLCEFDAIGVSDDPVPVVDPVAARRGEEFLLRVRERRGGRLQDA